MKKNVLTPKNLWKCKYDGEPRIIKATQGQMEWLYQNDPKMSDYTPLVVSVLPKEVPEV